MEWLMKVEASDGRKNHKNYHNTQINRIFGEVASTPSSFVRRHFADTNNWWYFDFFCKKLTDITAYLSPQPRVPMESMAEQLKTNH